MLKGRPACPTCGGPMHLHGSYPRGIVTKYGLIELKMPLFQCPSDPSGLSPQEFAMNAVKGRSLSPKPGSWRSSALI